jgi:GTPase KRas protein
MLGPSSPIFGSFLSLRPPSAADSHSCSDRYDPTIEDSYSITRTIDGLPYFLSLTDTAGQEEYRGLWAASNLQSDAFLLVYDITNASSLDALDYFMDMIDIEEENRMEENNNAELRGVKGGKEMRAPPVKIVAGNKCDLKDSRVVSSRTGLEWARQRRCGFMETSAREMVNIEETFACTSHLHGRSRAAKALLPPAEQSG